jgi:hypothetical protein
MGAAAQAVCLCILYLNGVEVSRALVVENLVLVVVDEHLERREALDLDALQRRGETGPQPALAFPRQEVRYGRIESETFAHSGFRHGHAFSRQ